MRKTRAEIFAESDRRYPDFGGYVDHALSLGFETGARWSSGLPEAPTEAELSAEALQQFPTSADTVEDQIDRLRREGFRAGAAWGRTEKSDE